MSEFNVLDVISHMPVLVGYLASDAVRFTAYGPRANTTQAPKLEAVLWERRNGNHGKLMRKEPQSLGPTLIAWPPSPSRTKAVILGSKCWPVNIPCRYINKHGSIFGVEQLQLVHAAASAAFKKSS